MRSPSLRVCVRTLGLVLLALATAGCAAARRPAGDGPRELRLSPKLNPFIFFEAGDVLFVGVDGRAAQYAKDGRLVPLGLGLANLDQRALTLDREGIVLEDSDKNLYPVVSLEEFNREYRRSGIDDKLLDSFREVMALRYQSYSLRSWPLFPVKGSPSPVVDQVELGRNQYTVGYVYFPAPSSGIHGKTFTLLVRTKEHPDPFVVDFALK